LPTVVRGDRAGVDFTQKAQRDPEETSAPLILSSQSCRSNKPATGMLADRASYSALDLEQLNDRVNAEVATKA
jgi:hypothetical protein